MMEGLLDIFNGIIYAGGLEAYDQSLPNRPAASVDGTTAVASPYSLGSVVGNSELPRSSTSPEVNSPPRGSIPKSPSSPL